MPVKRYGIYLCYPPKVDLRAEGLGRQLAALLLAAQARSDVEFVIACPSWMPQTLRRLCDEAGVDFERLQILAPARAPKLLRIAEAIARLQKRPAGKEWLARLALRLRRIVDGATAWSEARLAGTRSALVLCLLLLAAIPVAGLVGIGRVLGWLDKKSNHLAQAAMRVCTRGLYGQGPRQVARSATIARLYRHMEAAEARLMHALIAARFDISAWYCPTAFWPHFNDIAGPRLMCVPDVVLGEFPIGFAMTGVDRFASTFIDVEQAIAGSHHLVTYSEHVKRTTLVERYHVDPDQVDVIPHGTNDLSALITVSGMIDNEAGTRLYCATLLRSALAKAVGCDCASIYGSGDVRFLFYASQLRPNKNVLTLLRAYAWLLRTHAIPHKLVLTACPNETPSVREFIAEQGIANDVLFLHGLSARELAACYKLADLAVNPSLSEGGLPFTFSEAVSVGTPVVMARIAVTTEVLGGAPFAQSMLFDPYDWRALADRIAWAVDNKETLYAAQRRFFDEAVAARTWSHVVEDYIGILERISRAEDRAGAKKQRVHA